MKKLNLLYISVFLLMTSGMLFSQAAADRLYLTTVSTGRVYDITALSATPTTAIALPTAVTTPGVPGGTAANASNLAVGYDVPGGSPSSLVFLQSNTVAGATIYKNGTAVTGTVMPSVVIGGIATNNVPGTYFGNVYGFQPGTKSLYPIYPSGAAVSITSTDTDWINGTTFGTDTFFDYQNNIYTFINNGSNRYLFKISIATGVAEKAISAPISGSASFANLPTASGIQGMAYLNGDVYIATTTATPTIEIRRISMKTGASTLVATYTSSSNANLDLATVPYYVPFQFTCGGITQSSSVPFVRNVASNGQKFLNIPISNVYADGNYTINIIGANFNSSSVVNITTSTTSIQVPLVYDGGGAAGVRTLQVNLNGSSTACNVNVLVDEDTDGDGIGNSEDMDDDNDGILDTVEDACATEGTPVLTETFGTGSRTSDSYVLNHTYTATGTIDDGFYAVTNSTDATDTFNKTDLTGNLDAGNPNIAAGSTTGRYLMINVGPNLLNQAIYRRTLAVTNGTRYRFRIDMAGLANGTGDIHIPNLQLAIKDTNGNLLASANSDQIGMANDDVWRRLALNFVASTTSVVLEIVNLQPNGTNGNDIGIDNIVLVPVSICDTDGDGIPNSLDFDSDNDGCFDAIEGSENVLPGQLNANGSINIATTGGVGSTPGVNYGVPNLVNAGGAADTGSNVGQGIGDSQSSLLNTQCLDTDADGLPDNIDLDDDNDGIVDCVEKEFAPNSSVSTIFKFNGSTSQISSNELRLTPDEGSKSGNAWSYGKVDFAKSFTISYSAYFGTKDADGADGIATVFHNSGVNATGGGGSGIGAQGIVNGIVLEIDTYNNGTGFGDIANDHGQIWVSSNQSGAGLLTTATDLGNVEDGLYHNIVVNWNFATKTLSYTLDGINAGIYTFPAGTPITSYFGGVSKVYFGYTASTGGSSNDQRVRFNSFCSDLPIELDTDNDGVPNHLDVDSDNDGCADAIEGSENVKYNQIHALDLPASDPNYAYRGQIKVKYDGVTTGSPSQIISTSAAANGVPQLLNNAENNLNASTNPSNLAGTVDNTDGTADIGQGIGDSQDNTINSCKCYKAPSTDSNTYPTQHGITAFNRAGVDNQNWPMVRQSGWTALEASTKGFVINRMPASTTGGYAGEPVDGTTPVITSPIAGMMFYDTTNDCLKINVDGTRSGWKCFNKQTCPDEN